MSQLIDPNTLPANFDLKKLDDVEELKKYAIPVHDIDEMNATASSYFDDELLFNQAGFNEKIGAAVVHMVENNAKNLSRHYADYTPKRIYRIYVDYRMSPPMTDQRHRNAIKAVITKKKNALAAQKRRKDEAIKKAQNAAATLQALGIAVTLPDDLKKPEKVKKTKVKN